MRKNIPVLVLFFSLATLTSLFSEDIFLFSRASFINAQFWERQITDDDSLENRKIMSNFTGGSIGTGFEFVLWDLGKKRGSRLFIISGADVAFLSMNYLGELPDELEYSTIKSVPVYGGATYTGLDLDFYLGGTFPKTDLKWGVGSLFYFMFPAYSSIALSESGNFSFFAAPSVFLAYDFFIKNTDLKITPMLRGGITCSPLIPDEYFENSNVYEKKPENWYSGLYIDLSVSVSFKSYKWKK